MSQAGASIDRSLRHERTQRLDDTPADVSRNLTTIAAQDSRNVAPLPQHTWFRTLEGHRYGKEIAVVLAVKLALLLVLWFVVIKPWPRPSTPPSDVVRHLYIPATPVQRHD
jgi:hypothetical protein